MSKRPRDEFFEVFRRSPGEPRRRASWTGPADKPGERSVRRGVLILCVTAAVVAAILAYALGYSRGKAGRGGRGPIGESPSAVSARSARSSESETVAGSDIAPAPGEPFHTVRVMSAVPLANAVRLRDDLRAMGYRDVFVYEARGVAGSTYTVNIGRFSTLQDRTALELKEKIRDRTYKGERAFKDAYIIRIADPGRIYE